MKNVYALLTARKGSKSVINKNIELVNDKELYLHNVDASIESRKIIKTYISTDIENILSKDFDKKVNIIKRPDILCQDDSSHLDAIKHGLEIIEKDNGKIDVLVILLGNALGTSGKELDDAIEILVNDKNADSILSVSEFNMFNPFRSFSLNSDYLKTTISPNEIEKLSKMTNINDKKSAGSCYFFNGSFMICKRESLFCKDSYPFTWLGKNILPYITIDTRMEIDAQWQMDFIKGQKNV